MINVASTYTADVMRPWLNVLLQKFCMQDVDFFYNQIFQQALFAKSEFNQNENGINVILIRLTDLFEYQNNNKLSKTEEQKLDELANALCIMEKNMHVPSLIIIKQLRLRRQIN